MSLRDFLEAQLPALLPVDPENAINGTRLIAQLRGLPGGDQYDEKYYRSQLSTMAGILTSPIAKRSNGHGYYLRKAPEETPAARDDFLDSIEVEDETIGRQNQREEKFRHVFMRREGFLGVFPVYIEHARSVRQSAGIGKWKFPDVILVEWNTAHEGPNGKIDGDLLTVMQSLGEAPFRLTSVELKVVVTAASLREYFFQCLSNSRWAHEARLVIATDVSDEAIEREMRRLSSSFGVSIVTCGLSLGQIDNIPIVSTIRSMSDAEFGTIIDSIVPRQIASGQVREALDWDHIEDLRNLNKNFDEVFKWIARCLRDQKARTIDNYRQLIKLEA